MKAARPSTFFYLLAILFLAVCPSYGQDALTPDKVAEYISKKWPINAPLAVTNLEQAYQFQDQVVQLTNGRDDIQVGYKAALTSKSLQERFHYDRPVLGVLRQNMLLRDRVILDEGFAVRPVLEADLMVVVKDESINDAVTFDQVLAALEGINPIIEMADLRFAEGFQIDPLWITAVNAGACAAVVGDPLLIGKDYAALAEKLPAIHASVMDKQGTVLASGSADVIMGNPLNAVLWIRDEVKSRGGHLKKGDCLWLGAITTPLSVSPGESYQVLFTGLQEYPVSIQVNIRTKSP